MAVARGAIRTHEHARQQHDFSGLNFGSITPTDSDGEIEFMGRCFVFLEFKYGEWTLEKWQQKYYGQKLAFERKADSMTKPTLLVLAQHAHKAPADIDAANAIVVAYRVNRRWRELDAPRTVRKCVEWFLRQHGYEG